MKILNQMNNTMKELEQKALNLIDKFRNYVDSEIGGETSFTYSERQETKNATQCAIQSVNHTIETLQKLIDKIDIDVNSYLSTHDALKEQIQLKNILEGRL